MSTDPATGLGRDSYARGGPGGYGAFDARAGYSAGAERPGVDDLSVTHRPDGHDTPDVGDVSLGTLVGNLTGDLSRLMRAELALAKAEAKEEAAAAGRGAGLLAGAGVGGHLVLVFASLALMFALGSFMPVGWGALVVALLWAIATGVLYSAGRTNLRRAAPPLQEAVDTLKEDAQWAKRPRG